jgi:hypothetical protein
LPDASWIHAERLVHKLETFTDEQYAAQQHLRGLIWWYYADLKAYCADPTSRRRSELRARFDRIFLRTTGFENDIRCQVTKRQSLPPRRR